MMTRLIEERLGLDPESLGSRAYSEALKAIGTLDEHDANAWNRAVERLVVPETWFFRGMVFDELARRVQSLNKPARILSLPCSTGEEPYSLAMALLEAGVSKDQWEIVGVDVSRNAIASATRGVYREFSFREVLPDLRKKYFRAGDGGWILNDDIRQRVRFEIGNVLDYTAAPFDVILCRNLLIYLTPASRMRALDRLFAMLAPEGVIGVGHAEPSALADRKVIPTGASELFLFTPAPAAAIHRTDIDTDLIPKGSQPLAGGRSAAETTGYSLTLSSTPEGSQPAASLALRPLQGRKQEHTEPRVSAALRPGANGCDPSGIKNEDNPVANEEPDLGSIRKLADAGHLSDALAACHSLLATAPSAEAYALAGLIHQARGDADAAVAQFRKALYLDPTNATARAMKAGGAR